MNDNDSTSPPAGQHLSGEPTSAGADDAAPCIGCDPERGRYDRMCPRHGILAEERRMWRALIGRDAPG